jgi:hypothetical protein
LRSWVLCALLAAGAGAVLAPPAAWAQQALQIKPLAEKKVTELPSGTLYWRIERFDSIDQARAAARDTWSLAVEAADKAWLFTLGPKGAAPSAGATPMAEVGPIPRISASQYLLRINRASGPPGSITAVHSHPGSEAFFVLSGEQSIRGARGVLRVKAGEAEAGNGADMAMQVSSSGTTDLDALVMFVVDAGRPFSSPAALP